jgi:hypothetical protein
MTTTEASRTILVLGMHRSGTSALAGALVKAGVCAGDASTLYGADQFNEKGFYEQREVVDINESILIRKFLNYYPEVYDYGCSDSIDDFNGLGWLFGSWVDNHDMAGESEIGPRIDKFLSQLWNTKQAPSGFIIKDPRLSLTFPLWEKYLGKPIILIMVRNPAAVAVSLWRRDQIYDSLSHALWLRYTHAAMSNAMNRDTIVIDYDRFIEQPESMMNEVFSWLRLKGLDLAEEKRADGIRFVSPSLRHHYPRSAVVLPEEISEYYQQIRNTFPKIPAEYVARKQYDKASCPWQSVMYLLARKTLRESLRKMRERLLHAEMAHQRLTNHPLGGAVIRMLSTVKKDPSFGSLNYYLLPESKRSQKGLSSEKDEADSNPNQKS